NGRWRLLCLAGACPDAHGTAWLAQPSSRRCQAGRAGGLPPLLPPALSLWLSPLSGPPLLWRLLPSLPALLWLRLWLPLLWLWLPIRLWLWLPIRLWLRLSLCLWRAGGELRHRHSVWRLGLGRLGPSPLGLAWRGPLAAPLVT